MKKLLLVFALVLALIPIQALGEVSATQTIDITEAAVYTAELQAQDGEWAVESGTDVTAWLVTQDGAAAFAPAEGVAVAEADGQTLTITVDASKIEGFATNGPSEIYASLPAEAVGEAQTVAIGAYTIPTVSVESNIYGHGYTQAKTGWGKEVGDYDQTVVMDDTTSAVVTLTLDGLDDSAIDSTGAVVKLDEGDGYYVEEYVLFATTLDGDWSDGVTEYTIPDHEFQKYYLVDDRDIGRGWTALGGDGQGDYRFNFTVSGITYNGLPLASQTFPVEIYIYGYNYTSDALSLYGEEGTTVEVTFAPLSDAPAAADAPVWTWVGDGEKPILCDTLADNFYITWPEGVDASALTAEDIVITLQGAYDSLELTAGTDYLVNASASETQIAVPYVHWAFIPVYTTMTIEVQAEGLETQSVYDVASVYVYETQHGGAGQVSSFSFYGLSNLTERSQLVSDATYVLSYTEGEVTRYYAEDENGVGSFVEEEEQASVYDGNGIEDRNIKMVGNNISIERAIVPTADKEVDGATYTFTKVYSGGSLLSPQECDPTLEAEPGYIIPWGTSNWITNEKWAWQSNIAIGWTGIDIQPYTGKYSWRMEYGTEQQFEAVGYEGEVVWTLWGDHSEGTTLVDGLLTVAEDETARTVFVIVSSVDNLYDIAAVSVTMTAPEAK